MHKKEISGILWLGLSIIIFLSLISFSSSDLSVLQTPPNQPPQNMIGIAGAWLGFVLYSLFGTASYLLVFFTFSFAILHFSPFYETKAYLKVIGCSILLLSLAVFFSITGIGNTLFQGLFTGDNSRFAGGIIGNFLSSAMMKLFGDIGTYIVISVAAVAGIILTSFHEDFYFFLKRLARFRSYRVGAQEQKGKPSLSVGKPKISSRKASKTVKAKKDSSKEEEEEVPSTSPAFSLPPISLLNDPPAERTGDDSYIYDNSTKLENALAEFGIKAKVASVQKGPVITSYELEPGVGVKVQSIVSLADDIALALRAPSIRVVAPIPGKAVMGVEIPNPNPKIVCLKEILESSKFTGLDSKLAVAMGKDIRGEPVVDDLRGMPHLLIAGTTGSGKTVCLHSLISSILFNAYPHEVKFLLIDPKMVELAPFSQIPHLYAPIVTMAKEAPAALQWIVEEMESRYGKLAEVGVRHIDKFNERMEKEGNESEKMPYIVVIIDELADLMAVASRKIEEMIMRLAQLSRAAGIHLILATQRPSVDVITGIIKANFPYRISFQVSSRVDSRTVLDSMGAEKLLGKGDMLYLPAGSNKPIRVQGSLVTEEEIERVVQHLEGMGSPDFSEVDFKLDKGEKRTSSTLPAEKDPLFKEAVRIILTTNQASASNLQRRMSIGYARAGRIIDLMQEEGIIGPPQGSKPRDILVDESYLEKLEESSGQI
jgi:S-DNA-T family DNA segregation ATPase FtsK/SpoIIIE